MIRDIQAKDLRFSGVRVSVADFTGKFGFAWWNVTVHASVNSIHTGMPIGIHCSGNYPKLLFKQEAAVRWEIERLFCHELEEQLTADGKHIYDPHGERQ